MLEQFKRMASSAFDILIDTYDQDMNTQTRLEQELCGLWLAFRRGELKLTLDQVAHRAELDPYLLTLLETGLATVDILMPDLVLASQWRQLALVLENESHDFDWVLSVIYAALGMPSVHRMQIMEKINADLALPFQHLTELSLDALTSPTQTSASEAVEQATHTAHTHSPEIEQVLVALAHGFTTALKMRNEIAKRTNGDYSLGIAPIYRILEGLEKGEFLQISGETEHKENIYMLTASGQRIAELAIQVEEQRTKSMEQRQRAALYNKQAEEFDNDRTKQEYQLYALLAPGFTTV